MLSLLLTACGPSHEPEKDHDRSMFDQTRKKPVTKEIDLGSLLGKPRRVVEKALGPPTRVEEMRFQTKPSYFYYHYPWGQLSYTGDRFDWIDYAYRSKPNSVKEALLKVGLDESSTPMREGHAVDGSVVTYFWKTDDGSPFKCCGRVINNLIINSDFSGISISVSD